MGHSSNTSPSLSHIWSVNFLTAKYKLRNRRIQRKKKIILEIGGCCQLFFWLSFIFLAYVYCGCGDWNWKSLISSTRMPLRILQGLVFSICFCTIVTVMYQWIKLVSVIAIANSCIVLHLSIRFDHPSKLQCFKII